MAIFDQLKAITKSVAPYIPGVGLAQSAAKLIRGSVPTTLTQDQKAAASKPIVTPTSTFKPSSSVMGGTTQPLPTGSSNSTTQTVARPKPAGSALAVPTTQPVTTPSPARPPVATVQANSIPFSYPTSSARPPAPSALAPSGNTNVQGATIPTTTPQAPMPNTPPSNSAALEALRRSLLSSYDQSPEERDAQSELERLIAQQANLAASEGLGLAKIEDQPIVLDLIRGQQAALQRQTAAQQGALGAQAAPLESRLQALQASRELAQKRAEKELGFAEADRTGEKPIEIGGALVRFNPATGAYEEVYRGPGDAAEGFTLGEGQMRYDAKGNLIASGGEKQASLPATVEEYKYAQSQGYTGSFMQYQDQKRAADASGKPLSGEAAKVLTIAQTMVPEIEQLKAAFSNNYQGALAGILSGTNRDLVKLVDQVADKVGRLRSGGAINKDEEARFKRQIASLSDIAFGNKDGAVAALDSLIKEAQGVSQGITGGAASMSAPVSNDQQQVIDQLIQQGLSPDEIEEAIGRPVFNKPLSMGEKGSAQAIAAAIKKVESNGNYGARGGSGEYGAYQFMPGTWKSWAGKYLGNPGAPMTAENQDYVAQSRINELLAQGKSAGQIALIWNGGQPVVKRGVNQFGVKYDSGAYARKVLGALKNLTYGNTA